jgi:hypothetical protein
MKIVKPCYFKYDQWMKSRDQYLDWVSDFLTEMNGDHSFKWKGFNLWNITLIAKKDVESDKEWFKKIHERVNGFTEPRQIQVMSLYFFLIKFLALFTFDLLKLFICKHIAKKIKPPFSSSDILFHSLSSNLQLKNDISFDRHYKYAPLSDIGNGEIATYLIFLSLGINDVRNFFNFRKTIRNKLSLLSRNVILLNQFLSISNIISIYVVSIRKWIIFRRQCKKKEFEQFFYINGVFCGDILIKEIERSFLGEIQWSLVYGVSFEEWMRRESIKKACFIITYGESLSTIRPVYFFTKKINPLTRFFSIQHSMNSRNKIALYHRKGEFKSTEDGELDLNLFPDFYLVQGNQFEKIASEFYPADRIKIIGCLKYDETETIRDPDGQIKSRVFDKIGYRNDMPIMLIAPSVSDFESLISLFSERYIEGWRIILCPHPANRKEIIEKLKSRGSRFVQIEVFDDLETSDLYKVASIVVCGYSVSAYEAIMNNVPAIQFANLDSLPLVDPDSEIPFFNSKNAFWEWFINNEKKLQDFGRNGYKSGVVQKYFYKTDGKAKNRLWEFIVAAKKEYTIKL